MFYQLQAVTLYGSLRFYYCFTVKVLTYDILLPNVSAVKRERVQSFQNILNYAEIQPKCSVKYLNGSEIFHQKKILMENGNFVVRKGLNFSRFPVLFVLARSSAGLN